MAFDKQNTGIVIVRSDSALCCCFFSMRSIISSDFACYLRLIDESGSETAILEIELSLVKALLSVTMPLLGFACNIGRLSFKTSFDVSWSWSGTGSNKVIKHIKKKATPKNAITADDKILEKDIVPLTVG